MSSTVTTTKIQVKNKEKDLKEATSSSKNLDQVLDKVQQIDNVCSYSRCKNKTVLIGIDCKYCNARFCTTHGLPEIHGCGEAVKRDEKRHYHHPEPKLTKTDHEKAQTKLTMKLKQMELERKQKQGDTGKGKKRSK